MQRLVSIKSDIPLGSTVRMYQIYELFEQFFFPVTAIDLLFRKVTLNLVVGVEKENLQQVLCNGFAIQIFRIAVDALLAVMSPVIARTGSSSVCV